MSKVMETRVKELFERYERLFNLALAGETDLEQVAGLYASEFIAATPAGVMTGKNDSQLRQVMSQGYAHYRALGTKQMRIGSISVHPIDDHHCLAHVAWTATYARPDLAETALDFDVHYLVQMLDADARVFGWVAGDEQALLRERGII